MKLTDTNNENYLKEVLAFAENKQAQHSKSIEELPTPIQELLNESIQQADDEKLISHNEVVKEVEERYNLRK